MSVGLFVDVVVTGDVDVAVVESVAVVVLLMVSVDELVPVVGTVELESVVLVTGVVGAVVGVVDVSSDVVDIEMSLVEVFVDTEPGVVLLMISQVSGGHVPSPGTNCPLLEQKETASEKVKPLPLSDHVWHIPSLEDENNWKL